MTKRQAPALMQKRKKTDQVVRVRLAAGIMPLPSGVGVDNARNYVSADEPANVRLTRFVRKRIAKGELLIVDEVAPNMETRKTAVRASKKAEE